MVDASVNLFAKATVQRSTSDDYPRAGFHLFTNRVDKSPTQGAWRDIDVSGDGVPAGATGAIFQVLHVGTTGIHQGSLRAKGSTDADSVLYDEAYIGYEHYSIHIVKLDNNRVCQGQIDNGGVHFYLIGYTDDRVQFPYKNLTDVTPGTSGSWETIDLSGYIPASFEVGSRSYTPSAAILALRTDGFSTYDVAVRAVGSSDTHHPSLKYDASSITYAIVKLNASRTIEGYISNTSAKIFFVAYCLPPITALLDVEDITPGTKDQWTEIDVSSNFDPEAVTAIIQHAPDNIDDYCIGKPHGTTDNLIDDGSGNPQGKVDLGKHIYQYLPTFEGSANLDIYMANGSQTGKIYGIGYSLQDDPVNLLAKGIIRHTATKDLFGDGEVAHWEDLFCKGVIRHTATRDLFSDGEVAHWEDLFTKGIIRHSDTNNLFADATIRYGIGNLFNKGIIRHTATKDLFNKGIIRHSDTKDLFADAIIAHWENLFCKGIIRHTDTKNLFGKGETAQWERIFAKGETAQWENLFCKGIIRHTDTKNLRAEARVTAEGWAMQGLTAGVYRDLGIIS